MFWICALCANFPWDLLADLSLGQLGLFRTLHPRYLGKKRSWEDPPKKSQSKRSNLFARRRDWSPVVVKLLHPLVANRPGQNQTLVVVGHWLEDVAATAHVPLTKQKKIINSSAIINRKRFLKSPFRLRDFNCVISDT